MEMLLKELALASKLLSDFKDMYEYENRLKTFTKWPFIKNCKCTPENVSLKWIFWLWLIFYISCLNVKSLLNILTFKKSCELPLSLKKKLNTPTFLCSLLRNTVVGWLASACSVHWSSYRIDYSYLSCFLFFLVLKCLCCMASTRCYLVEQSYSSSLQIPQLCRNPFTTCSLFLVPLLVAYWPACSPHT